LINPNVFPPVIDGLHEAVHESPVNIFFGDSVDDALELPPFICLTPDVDIHEKTAAFVGIEQGPPFPQRNTYSICLARNFYRRAAGGMNFDTIGLSLFEYPEVQGGYVAGDDDARVIGRNIWLASDLRTLRRDLKRRGRKPHC
jgi:hypothetical protein